MLISSFKLENGTVITPLLNFYLELGLHCSKNYRSVQCTPRKCFNNFVQSVVDARKEGDENPLSGVVAATMKFLGNSSYGFQIMDRSRHTITKYLNDEKNSESDQSAIVLKIKYKWKRLVRGGVVEINQWAPRTHHCWFFYTSVCKAEKVGTLL